MPHAVCKALLGTFAVCAVLCFASCASKPKMSGGPIPAPERASAAKAREYALDAQRAERAGDVERAITLYQQSVQTAPDLHWSIWNNLGLLLMKRFEYPGAGAAFRTAAEFPGSGSVPLENLGLLYHETGHDEQALSTFIDAIGRNPRSVDAHRGALRASKRLRVVDDAALRRVEAALLIESDPMWRDILMREKVTLESRLENQAAASTRVR